MVASSRSRNFQPSTVDVQAVELSKSSVRASGAASERTGSVHVRTTALPCCSPASSPGTGTPLRRSQTRTPSVRLSRSIRSPSASTRPAKVTLSPEQLSRVVENFTSAETPEESLSIVLLPTTSPSRSRLTVMPVMSLSPLLVTVKLTSKGVSTPTDAGALMAEAVRLQADDVATRISSRCV